MADELGFLVAHSKHGLGRVTAMDKRTVRVKFFAGDAAEQEFAAAAFGSIFKRHAFYAGQRCHGPSGECVVRVVLPEQHRPPHRYYEVQTADGALRKASEAELTPLPDVAVHDPLALLSRRTPDSYLHFQARENLVDALARQWRAGAGLHALLSSRIDLHPHQAYVAGTVILDQRRRYLLADEVGLGKTIEAGVVMHDLLSQKPQARILVICPAALCSQWLSEMYSKFGGNPFAVLDMHRPADFPLEGTRRAIVSTARLLHEWAAPVESAAWDMLVVDEAHHLLSTPGLYERIQRLAQKVPSVLLLSAIPAQRRKIEFLQLLALLEPERYGKGLARERFDELYDAQKVIGRRLRLLTRRLAELNDGSADADEVVAAAQRLVESPVVCDDEELRKQVRQLTSTSADLPASAQKLAHLVADRFRIHRRILRNRRQRLLEQQTLAPIERKLQVHTFPPDPLEASAAASVAQLLREAGSNGLDDALLLPLTRALQQGLASPETLLTWLETLEKAPVGKGLNARGRDVVAHGQLSSGPDGTLYQELLCLAVRDALPAGLLARTLRAAKAWKRANDRPRLNALTRLLERIRGDDSSAKVLVFAGFPGLAEDVVQHLMAHFGSNTVAEFVSSMELAQKEDSVQRFRNRAETWVLVCDESGGEGRNFQFASELIHVDTPWQPARVEQRIGRLDRMRREEVRSDVLSHVLCADGTIEHAFVGALDAGLGVYRASLSGLEFALREMEDSLAKAALREEPLQALDELVPTLRARCEEERALDGSEAVLDESSFERATADRFLRVQNSPDADRALEAAFIEYLLRRSPQAVQKDGGGVYRLAFDLLVRGQLHVQQAATTTAPFKGTFVRSLAQEKPSLHFFSVGHVLFESVVGGLESEPGGCTYALECVTPNHGPWRGMEFVFQVAPAPEVAKAGAGVNAQVRALLPRGTVHVFVDEHGVVAEQPGALLQARQSLRTDGKDRDWWNLTHEKAVLLESAFRFGSWESTLKKLHSAAEAHARTFFAQRLEPELQDARQRLDERLRQARAVDGASAEVDELVALAGALDDWRLRLDAAGFLSINMPLLSQH